MADTQLSPVGRWSGEAAYAGNVDEFIAEFSEDGTVRLDTPHSDGAGSWASTGPDAFSFAVKEVFRRDENGELPPKVLPGAAYIRIAIEARREDDVFTGPGTAEICTAEGQVMHSVAVEIKAQLAPAEAAA